MSRIGKIPIIIPTDVKVDIDLKLNQVTVTGPKGQLTQNIPNQIKITNINDQLIVENTGNSKISKSNHGLIRSLIANLIIGVTQGYSKTLELVGTGYRVAKQGDKLTLNLGFSHPVEIEPVVGLSYDLVGNNKIIISGIDKQLVGQIAAKIRSLRVPEVYKGKGIRYQDEVIRRKPGKAAKVGAAGE